jgi:hypothetical protein
MRWKPGKTREEDRIMKRLVSVAVVVTIVGGLAATALAHGPGWGRMMGPGYGPMHGQMGMMQGRMAGGFAGCPGFAGAAGGPASEATQVTEEQAKALATEYAEKHFTGYTVERVLPFQGRLHTMYQVELKGPKGETRVLHVTPWGGVRPFGPPAVAAQ